MTVYVLTLHTLLQVSAEWWQNMLRAACTFLPQSSLSESVACFSEKPLF